MTLTAGTTPGTGGGAANWSTISTNSSTALVDLRVLQGNPELPSQMYMRAETCGANYGNSYGLSAPNVSNTQLDWGPDSQGFRVIYIGFGNVGYVAKGTGGTQNGYAPSTMAVWGRAAEPEAPSLADVAT